MTIEFPRLVYKSASESCLANTEKDFHFLLKKGWYASVPEAINKKHNTVYTKNDTVQVSQNSNTGLNSTSINDDNADEVVGIVRSATSLGI